MSDTNLDHNTLALEEAVSAGEPTTVVVGDGQHRGTALFLDTSCSDPGVWWVLDLEGRKFRGRIARLAVVTLYPSLDDSADDADPDDGLNQAACAVDLEVPGGEWVVDAEGLPALLEQYGEALGVLWVQGGCFSVRMADSVENTGLDGQRFATRQEAALAASVVNAEFPRANAEVIAAVGEPTTTFASWDAAAW